VVAAAGFELVDGLWALSASEDGEFGATRRMRCRLAFYRVLQHSILSTGTVAL
jgi:hypothetical protein